jgi:hypothetical protein
VLQVPVPDTLSWAGETADVRGVAVGTDGLIVLHQDRVEALSPAGKSLWTVALPAPPVRWGLALTDNLCVITLTDGQVIALGG